MDVSKITGNVIKSVNKIDMPKPNKFAKVAQNTILGDGDIKLQKQLEAIANSAKISLADIKTPNSLEEALYMTGYMNKVQFIPDAQNLLPKPMSAVEQLAQFYKGK